MSTHPLEEILHPRSIAVVGASVSGRSSGFITPFKELGFKGEVYPVNPKYDEILGMKAYARVTDIPGPVDYVISSIPATAILGLIDDCVKKGVKAVHLFTARFSETGRKEATELEQELLRRARNGGVRLIGPNCLGVYYPDMGIGFHEGMPKESGQAALISQSGQVVGEIVDLAAQNGVRFSKAISYGNALDFNECDYLEYFTQDEQTGIILMYVEGVREGKRFADSLRKAAAVKPVVILKGGRGDAGSRATASHTASMAGSRRLWESVVSQAGAISVGDIEELVDVAVGLYFTPVITGRRTAVAGGSGGRSVQAADQCEEAGLDIIPLPEDLREELKAQGDPVWDWIGNPADSSISMGDRDSTKGIMQLMAGHPEFDLLIIFMRVPRRPASEPFSMDRYMKRYRLREIAGKPIIMIFGDRPGDTGQGAEWYNDITARIKERLVEDKLPFYPGVGRAARAISKIIGYNERKRI